MTKYVNESAQLPAIPPEETFDGTRPFKARYTEAPGFRMHFIDEGSGRETMLLLQGEPTWSYLFRQQIPVWAARHRVIAVDHMGFGKSAALQDRTYWLQDHIDNLERYVLAFDLRELTLVMHDFGGPAGMGLAIRHLEAILDQRAKLAFWINAYNAFTLGVICDNLSGREHQRVTLWWVNRWNRLEKDDLGQKVCGLQ